MAEHDESLSNHFVWMVVTSLPAVPLAKWMGDKPNPIFNNIHAKSIHILKIRCGRQFLASRSYVQYASHTCRYANAYCPVIAVYGTIKIMSDLHVSYSNCIFRYGNIHSLWCTWRGSTWHYTSSRFFGYTALTIFSSFESIGSAHKCFQYKNPMVGPASRLQDHRCYQ